MANRHSLMWRKPGRRSAEREKFRRLMRKVEAIRLRQGMTKGAVAAKIGTDRSVLLSWVSGEAIARKASMERIKAFLKNRN